MSKGNDAVKAVVEESNPVNFWRRIRELPIVKQILAVIDRFL